MRVREYRPEDAWAIAEIEARCNLTDPLALYYRRIPSHGNDGSIQKERFWTAYVSSCRRFQEMKRLQPGTVCHVLEETIKVSPQADQHGGKKDHRDDDGSVVLGFAIWTRLGKSEIARQWQKRDRHWLTRLRAALYYIGTTLYYPFDPTINYRHISHIYPIISQPPSDVAPLAPERWEIDAMYIHPQWQRRGFGTQVLQWGLDQARRERAPVLARSTSQGYRLYRQAGFRSLKKLDFGGLFDPGEHGMHLMVWEPE